MDSKSVLNIPVFNAGLFFTNKVDDFGISCYAQPLGPPEPCTSCPKPYVTHFRLVNEAMAHSCRFRWP